MSDIPSLRRPYFERWLLNRDGFLKLYNSSIDYIGIEEVVRMGAFYNIYCLIENSFIFENDPNSHELIDATLYFNLYNGKPVSLGWIGGVLADILTKDSLLLNHIAKDIMKEEVKKLSISASNYACIIETRAWEYNGILDIYHIIDRIATNIRKLLANIHLGENLGV